MDTSTLAWVARILVLIGGINWGLVGLFHIDIVASLLGDGLLARLIYIVIGVAAGYLCYLIYESKKKGTV